MTLSVAGSNKSLDDSKDVDDDEKKIKLKTRFFKKPPQKNNPS